MGKHSTKEILKRIYASGGYQGELDSFDNREIYLFDAHEDKEIEKNLKIILQEKGLHVVIMLYVEKRKIALFGLVI